MATSLIIFHSSLFPDSFLCNVFVHNYASLRQEVLYNGGWNPCIHNLAVGELHDVATTGKMAAACKKGNLSLKSGMHGGCSSPWTTKEPFV